MVVATAMLWLGAAATSAQLPPSGAWQDAAGYLPLFAPFGPRADAYRIFVTTLPIDALLGRLVPIRRCFTRRVRGSRRRSCPPMPSARRAATTVPGSHVSTARGVRLSHAALAAPMAVQTKPGRWFRRTRVAI
jgi:hypothetical protein